MPGFAFIPTIEVVEFSFYLVRSPRGMYYVRADMHSDIPGMVMGSRGGVEL